MLAGNNSILHKATEAKQTTERSEAKEQARIDIMAWITDKTANHENASLDDSKVKTILTGKSYVKEAKDASFITAKGEYEILYSELYTTSDTPSTQTSSRANVKLASNVTTTGATTTFLAGQEVKIGEEHFFVLSDDGINMKLLTKYCLNKTDNSQLTKDATSSDYKIDFSNTNYWSTQTIPTDSTSNQPVLELQQSNIISLMGNDEEPSNNAILKAQSYGQEIATVAEITVTGRLMTYAEAYTIQNGTDSTLKDILNGTWTDGTQPVEGFLAWRLGAAFSEDSVWAVLGAGPSGLYPGGGYKDTTYGVRVVLEI